jgi:uncharacterized protein YmfQ (DUF2313 family)
MGIKDKLPKGKLFDDLGSGSNLHKFLSAFDESLKILQDYTQSVITDLDPRFTINFINEWSRLLDIESEVDAIPDIADKRQFIYNKLITDDIKTAQYFIDLILAESGYTATLLRYISSRAGKAQAGQPIQSDAGYTIKFEIQTNDNKTEIEYARAGKIRAGQLIPAHAIYNVEAPVCLQFPMILNLVFEFNDGVSIRRSFTKQIKPI